MATAVRFGRYELHEMLGRGGMGEVYRAFDTEQRRLVALKVLPDGVAGDPQLVERFRREAYAAAKLRNPHVLPVHTFGEIDGRLYIDMRLVDGRDLATLLATDGPLAPDRAVAVVGQVAEALDEAHAARLVHRDVKPSNVLLTGRDFAYLFDFGIAHAVGSATTGASLTSTGTTVGTLAYMAPERFVTPDRIDGRADVYSLACLLFELLTGRPPFPVRDLPALLHAHLHAPPPAVTALRPDVSAALDAVVARGMAKDPAARHPTAGNLAADAARALQAGGTPARVTGWPPAPAPTYVPPSGPQPAAYPPPPPTLVGPHRPAPPSGGRSKIPVVAAVGAAVVALLVLAGVVVGATRGGTGGSGGSSPVTRDTAIPVSRDVPTSTAEPAPDTGIPTRFAGTWTGRVTQTGAVAETYDVTITIVAGATRTAVAYPELGCSGRQELVGADGAELRLTERITVGAGRCVDEVPIVLTRDGDRLRYAFSLGGNTGSAVLTRG